MGVDAIIVQGVEAGGHVIGQVQVVLCFWTLDIKKRYNIWVVFSIHFCVLLSLVSCNICLSINVLAHTVLYRVAMKICLGYILLVVPS